MIGLSGGSDSVALTLLLQELPEQDELQRRGPRALEPSSSAARRRATSSSAAISPSASVSRSRVESIDVALVRAVAAAVGRGRGAPAPLRLLFTGHAESVAADRIAVGHTRDDQAETFLLKLIRGAGLTGLGGIYPRRGHVIRPLLDVGRADLRRYLESRGQALGRGRDQRRSREPAQPIRHRVLPELDLAGSASATPAIARAAAIVREDGQWLDELSDRRFDVLVARSNTGLEIDVSGLMAEPLPVRRRIVLTALRLVAPNREIGLDHVEVGARGSGRAKRRVWTSREPAWNFGAESWSY